MRSRTVTRTIAVGNNYSEVSSHVHQTVKSQVKQIVEEAIKEVIHSYFEENERIMSNIIHKLDQTKETLNSMKMKDEVLVAI